MPSRRRIKSVRKVVKKSARKVVRKSVKKSARKVVKKSVKKSVKLSVKKSRKAERKQKYTVCFLFSVYNPDDDEEEVNVKKLSANAKALFSKTIKEHCAIGFWGGFSVKNISFTFTLSNIRVTGTMDKNPNADVVEGMTLKEAVEVVDDKSVTQWKYGPDDSTKNSKNNLHDVESNGKKYALRGIELC